MATLTALTDLKTRWEAKFGDQPERFRPVSTHVVTPFQPQPVRMARRFPRLLSLDQQRAILTLPRGVQTGLTGSSPSPNRDNPGLPSPDQPVAVLNYLSGVGAGQCGSLPNLVTSPNLENQYEESSDQRSYGG
ncbi:UNVERIFIED_CONTAM: hypothetical protein Slati_0871700 [Sesamum latifolium]|uniref:Uncharacterized protein n=1 Tax=Sesamum latifolium TaxID=2727402 RepID=A0AAW2XU55_9LAMI